jgi:hypothetical protein
VAERLAAAEGSRFGNELPSVARFNTGRPLSFSGPRTLFTSQVVSSGSILGLFRFEPVIFQIPARFSATVGSFFSNC